MGTRADFYADKNDKMEWLGSVAFDGYPDGIPDTVMNSESLRDFRSEVKDMLAADNNATTPEMGWPWPWDDSSTSDYAYAHDGKHTWYTVGYPCRWWKHSDGKEPYTEEEGELPIIETLDLAKFPDMSGGDGFTLGNRSGLIVIGI